MSIEEVVKPLLIEGIQKTSHWYKDNTAGYLQSIFDQIGFIDEKPDKQIYYTVPSPLSSKIYYPATGKIEELASVKKETHQKIVESHNGLAPAYLETLTAAQLLFLLEKFGANIPCDDKCKMALFDHYKLLAAEEVLKINRSSSDPSDKLLIAIDISGIQKFIYNIVSKGALKNLRARSFYIELLCHHTVARILSAFNLHQVNVLMNGGGNVYILSHCPSDYEARLKNVNYSLNSWLLKEFNGTLYVTFCAAPWPSETSVEDILDSVAARLYEKKQQKFGLLIECGELSFIEDNDPGYERCEICYKDGHSDELKEIIGNDGKGSGTYRCTICDDLVKLGKIIPEARYIYSCDERNGNCVRIENSYYKLSFERESQECIWAIHNDSDDFLDDLKGNVSPILARTYTKLFSELPENIQREKEKYEDNETEGIATLEQMSDSATGAKFIGALRMDADNMGKLIRHGFHGGITLEGLSSLSRNINYFFRLYLDSICREGFRHEKEYAFLNIRPGGRIVQVIYAGGDDLFAIGAWSDTAALAVDIRSAFHKYTCKNIDIGLSAGLTLHQPRFPVIKMAEESAAALACAKHELQPCWMCRKEWSDCPLFEDGCLRKNAYAPFYTGYLAYRKKEIDARNIPHRYQEYSSRLNLALKWEEWDETGCTNEVEDYLLKPLQTLFRGSTILKKGFFHNSLQLLETWYEEGLLYLPRLVWAFDKIKEELKRKKEGQDGVSLYDLLMMHLHTYNTHQKDGNKQLASLHMPLSWIILLIRGGEQNGKD